jgi:hypothetical protein
MLGGPQGGLQQPCTAGLPSLERHQLQARPPHRWIERLGRCQDPSHLGFSGLRDQRPQNAGFDRTQQVSVIDRDNQEAVLCNSSRHIRQGKSDTFAIRS